MVSKTVFCHAETDISSLEAKHIGSVGRLLDWGGDRRVAGSRLTAGVVTALCPCQLLRAGSTQKDWHGHD